MLGTLYALCGVSTRQSLPVRGTCAASLFNRKSLGTWYLSCPSRNGTWLPGWSSSTSLAFIPWQEQHRRPTAIPGLASLRDGKCPRRSNSVTRCGKLTETGGKEDSSIRDSKLARSPPGTCRSSSFAPLRGLDHSSASSHGLTQIATESANSLSRLPPFLPPLASHDLETTK